MKTKPILRTSCLVFLPVIAAFFPAAGSAQIGAPVPGSKVQPFVLPTNQPPQAAPTIHQTHAPHSVSPTKPPHTIPASAAPHSVPQHKAPRAVHQNQNTTKRSHFSPNNTPPYVVPQPTGEQNAHPSWGGQQTDRLNGAVTHHFIDTDLSERLSQLMQAATARAADLREYDQALQKYGSTSGRLGLKDIGHNFPGIPKGFDASTEGAQLVLDKDGTPRSLEAAALGKQQRIDQMHKSIVASILEMACGLGCPNTADSQAHIKRGQQVLDELVGQAETDRTLDMLVEWTKNISISESAFSQKRWDLHQLQTKTAMASDLSLNYDPLVISLHNKLNNFGGHSKQMMVTAKVVEGTCSGASLLSPGFAVPIAARVVRAGWTKANGGSEQSKLLKELYYQKQLDIRTQTLSAEAQLAMLHYREALDTRNVPLLMCSEALVAQMVGAVGVPQVLEQPVLAHGTFLNRSIESTKQ